MKNDQQLNIDFVQVVEKYPLLYNYTLEDYTNKQVVDKIWKTIGKKFNETGEGCLEKWRTLRGGFVRNYRYRPPGSTLDARREYYLAKYMQFLKPFIKTRVPKSNFGVNSDQGSSQNILKIEDVTVNNTKVSDIEDELIVDHHNTSDSDDNELENSRQNKRKSDAFEEAFIDYVALKKAKGSETIQQFEERADLDFLKSLLPDMATLSKKQKNIFKIKVLNILNELIEDVPDLASASHSSSCDNAVSSPFSNDSITYQTTMPSTKDNTDSQPPPT